MFGGRSKRVERNQSVGLLLLIRGTDSFSRFPSLYFGEDLGIYPYLWKPQPKSVHYGLAWIIRLRADGRFNGICSTGIPIRAAANLLMKQRSLTAIHRSVIHFVDSYID